MIDTLRSVLANLSRSMNDPRACRYSEIISELYPNQRRFSSDATLLYALVHKCDPQVGHRRCWHCAGGAVLLSWTRSAPSLNPSYQPIVGVVPSSGSMRLRIFVRHW